MITIPMTVTTSNVELPMTVANSNVLLDMQLDVSYSMESVPVYDGEYEVTPRIYEQTLETQGKQMSDDVTVYEIPIITTTNPYGGQTVLIG